MPTRSASVVRRLALTLAVGVAAVAVAACGSSSSSSSSASSSAAASTTSTASTSSASTAASSGAPQLGYEGIALEQGPALAPASTTGTRTVDGIPCGATEQLAYHIHAHLAVFQNGRLYSLPSGVGIPGSVTQQSTQGPVAAGGRCIYWLHTHTSDGIIHIESPSKRIYTLGTFFDEWHQPLSANRVAGLHGKVVVWVNGKPWKRSPRAIPLLPHEDIQLNLGQPAPPLMTVNWGNTSL
jgi:hypothetical protein